jgi:hypothetical protein
MDIKHSKHCSKCNNNELHPAAFKSCPYCGNILDEFRLNPEQSCIALSVATTAPVEVSSSSSSELPSGQTPANVPSYASPFETIALKKEPVFSPILSPPTLMAPPSENTEQGYDVQKASVQSSFKTLGVGDASLHEARAEMMQTPIVPQPQVESLPVADQSGQSSASFVPVQNAITVSSVDANEALIKKGQNTSLNEATSPQSPIPTNSTDVKNAASNKISVASPPFHLQQERQSTAQLPLTQPSITPPSQLDNDPSKPLARETPGTKSIVTSTSGKLDASNPQNEGSRFQSQSNSLIKSTNVQSNGQPSQLQPNKTDTTMGSTSNLIIGTQAVLNSIDSQASPTNDSLNSTRLKGTSGQSMLEFNSSQLNESRNQPPQINQVQIRGVSQQQLSQSNFKDKQILSDKDQKSSEIHELSRQNQPTSSKNENPQSQQGKKPSKSAEAKANSQSKERELSVTFWVIVHKDFKMQKNDDYFQIEFESPFDKLSTPMKLIIFEDETWLLFATWQSNNLNSRNVITWSNIAMNCTHLKIFS